MGNNKTLLKLEPTCKDYIWGGTKLRDLYGFSSDADRLSEAWVMSAHPDGPSVIAGGADNGISLEEYVKREGREAGGNKWDPQEPFPLLVKFIDAKDNLSIQVHPDEEYANRVEQQHGKNEMWYVLDAEPGAGLYVGFKQDTTKEEVRRRIEDGTITDILNFFETKPGDFFFIPAGTVHAIGAGNLVCETQQSSNVTYRLYDYKRKDAQGNERELHIDKSLDVMNLNKYVPASSDTNAGAALREIVRCDYFSVSICNPDGTETIALDEDSFVSVICTKGNGSVVLGDERLEAKAGDSIFVPAVEGELELSGQAEFMISRMA